MAVNELTCGQGGSNGNQIVTQINDNTNGIATNVTDIADLDARIDALLIRVDELEAKASFTFVSETDILNISDTYTELANIYVADLAAGDYLLGLSSTYQLDVTNKSVFAQFSLNGGTPEEFRKEPKDNTDREAFTYIFPYTHAGGEFRLKLDMRKEDANGTLDCFFANMWVNREA